MLKRVLVISISINILAMIFGLMLIYDKGGIKKLIYKSVYTIGYLPIPNHLNNRISLFKKLRIPPRSIIVFGGGQFESLELREVFKRDDIFNRSVRGITISQFNESGLIDFANRSDQIIIALGINDIWTGRAVSEIEADFEELIIQLKRRYFYDVTFIAIFPVFHSKVAARNGDIRKLNILLKDLTYRFGYKFINVNESLISHDTLKLRRGLSYDGIYLTERGLDYLFKELKLKDKK